MTADNGQRTTDNGQLALKIKVLVLVGVLLVCCGEKERKKSWSEPVQIAVVAPLTGPLRPEGEMLRLGALLAMKDFAENSAQPQTELKIYDSPCGAGEASRVARRLAADPSVQVVVGYLCAESLWEYLPVYRQAGLSVVSPFVPDEQLPQGQRKHFFSLSLGGADQAAFLAAYAKKALGLRKAAVISDQSRYGDLVQKAFLRAAENQGLEVEAKIDAAGGAAQAVKAVQLLRSVQPEAVFLAACPESARFILLERYRQDVGGEILATEVLADSDLLEAIGPAAEGMLICQPLLLQASDPDIAAFVQSFEQFHKRRPDLIAAMGYDAVRLVLQVLARTGPGRKAMRRGLREVDAPEKAYDALGGPLFFGQGGSRRPLYVARVRQRMLEPAEPATIPSEYGARRRESVRQ